MTEGKSFKISQCQVLEAYKRVKANKGAGGIDGIELEAFEQKWKDHLYKVWNRMSSGSYFPKPVKGVEIPKKDGKKRLLGIPTIEDRIAQMVVRMELEESVERKFNENSYGYRPNRSAIDAIRVTRERCWRYPWVLEFDIKGLFDNIDHEMMMKLVRIHTETKWILLYTERFMGAPMIMPNGEHQERTSGTPQGGVISPVLANLFMHYAFDQWMEAELPNNPWVRYADDGVIHCNSKEEAEGILGKLENRMKQCKLEIHPEKTRIVYCKSGKFKQKHKHESFEFLGYTFRTRNIKNKYGQFCDAFTPAVSKSAGKRMREKVRKIRRNNKEAPIEYLANLMNPIIRGWMNYFTKFYGSRAKEMINYVNLTLARWIRDKYKIVRKSMKKAMRMLVRISEKYPKLFYQWQVGVKPTIG